MLALPLVYCHVSVVGTLVLICLVDFSLVASHLFTFVSTKASLSDSDIILVLVLWFDSRYGRSADFGFCFDSQASVLRIRGRTADDFIDGAGDAMDNKVILFLPDVFGIPLPNNPLLVDDFARNGFKTILPDYLNGDPVPAAELEADLRYPEVVCFALSDATRPVLDKVIAALKDAGVTDFGATGYCFGGRYVFDLAFDNAIKVGVASHPSLLKFPDDFELYHRLDVPKEIHEKTDAIFAKFEPGYKREYFDGCTHGFAVRGDLSDPKVKAGKEGAFVAAVEWFLKYL
ncbi:hypothetical protein BDZ89DRAFT_1143503 [Hymenopellis radicata]|nr:hypothetical protein BDZ89DRAFT_1143503 [Hymenopellis radicata]